MSIGIYINAERLRFYSTAGESIITFDQDLKDEEGQELSIYDLFSNAQDELDFSPSEDFRLLVDFPLCHSVVQTVPFPEGQLAQVLENYLEEELPCDLEDCCFDYRVLASKGSHTSAIGFWISRKVVAQWSELSDELSLNSLDIQPAEMTFLPDFKAEPKLSLTQDGWGKVRYSCFVMRENLPSFSLGALPASSSNPESLAKLLLFQGTDWANIKKIECASSLENYEALPELLGIEEAEFIKMPEDESPDSFALYALAKQNPITDVQFNYRKGEFARKGMDQYIALPIILISLALTGFIGSVAWKKYDDTEKSKMMLTQITESKKEMWTKLYPTERFNSSRLLHKLKDRLGVLNKEGGDIPQDESQVSALQVLGKLFSYIDSDEGVMVLKASITSSISLTGTAENSESVFELSKNFKNQDVFKEPEISDSPNRSGEGRSFKFNTGLVKKDR
ncbi:MAG: hypothetical protein HQL32_05705 [Planctomycetes bacterium]|nr:hypothetical protein [Planctomycetota bacterium]